MANFAPHIKISEEMPVVLEHNTFGDAVIRFLRPFLNGKHPADARTLQRIEHGLASLVLEYERRRELQPCNICVGQRFFHIGFDPPNRMLVIRPCETCTNLHQRPKEKEKEEK